MGKVLGGGVFPGGASTCPAVRWDCRELLQIWTQKKAHPLFHLKKMPIAGGPLGGGRDRFGLRCPRALTDGRRDLGGTTIQPQPALGMLAGGGKNHICWSWRSKSLPTAHPVVLVGCLFPT